jgi:hypothetical protein
MRKTLLAAASVRMIAAAPTSSQADAVGAAFGAGTGLVVAGAYRCRSRRRHWRGAGAPILGVAD